MLPNTDLSGDINTIHTPEEYRTCWYCAYLLLCLLATDKYELFLFSRRLTVKTANYVKVNMAWIMTG